MLLEAQSNNVETKSPYFHLTLLRLLKIKLQAWFLILETNQMHHELEQMDGNKFGQPT